LNNSTHGFLVN